ncbi:MAG: Trk system potassium transporter TrkA, partial [Firmicutes bacterium]|nr:Trk system potassium transporter TrkA [Bacillota bacterium]
MKIIVVGAGKVGFVLAQMLSNDDHDVTVVDRNASRVETVEERLDVNVVLGSCTSTEVLMKAGVHDADMLVAVTERDELNIVSCFIAKSYGVHTTVARVRSPEFADLDRETVKKSLGIDLMINPERIAADQICKILDYPDATSVEYFNDGRVVLMEFKIEPNTAVNGKYLREIKTDFHYLIVGIIRNGNMIIPRGNDVIKEGDRLYLFTPTKYIPEVEEDFGQDRKKVRNVVIAGGDTISYYLASELEKRRMNIKIFEEDIDKCKRLAESLDDSLVIHGDATDIHLLRDENIEEADAFIAVAEEDNFNILSAVIAKELGASRTIIQLKMSDYMDVSDRIGIDQSISPRILAAAHILRFFHGSNVLSLSF